MRLLLGSESKKSLTKGNIFEIFYILILISFPLVKCMYLFSDGIIFEVVKYSTKKPSTSGENCS